MRHISLHKVIERVARRQFIQRPKHGGFRLPFHERSRCLAGTRLEVIELPLVFMDANLVEGEDGYLSFKNLFGHLEKIGGVISVLFHPGTFANPERPDLEGLYLRILEFANAARARNLMPSDIIRIAAKESNSVL